jgi:hypothetical protein
MRGLGELTPAYQNGKVYRPVRRDDPEILELAQSIREHGLKEPLVASIDNVLLSGHRRYVACMVAELYRVPCRIEPVRSTDPEFFQLLVEYNRQRVKTVDECFREALVTADTDEPYRQLIKHRKARARVEVETIPLRAPRARCKITKAKWPFLQAIEDIIQQRMQYWPLTDRQIHYALLNDPPLIHASKPESRYKNDHRSYRACVDLITRARHEELISWDAVHDPTRPMVTWEVYRNPAEFINKQLEDFLENYCRDLLQSQANQVEIVGEKNTIENIVRPVAMEFCIPYTLGRGYASSPPRKKMAQRFEKSGKEKLVLLFMTDFDCEGQDIPESFARSMRDEFHIKDIVPIQVALKKSQVEAMNLPPEMKAKPGSSRYTRFVEQNGENTFELEAVPPDRMQRILRDTIDSVLDLDAFNAEVELERKDAKVLAALRDQMKDLLDRVKLDHGQVPDQGS